MPQTEREGAVLDRESTNGASFERKKTAKMIQSVCVAASILPGTGRGTIQRMVEGPVSALRQPLKLHIGVPINNKLRRVMAFAISSMPSG